MNTESALGSRFWPVAFRVQYRILALVDPIVRRTWRRRGIGNIVELEVARRSGRGTRQRLVGVLHSQGKSYIGHPNGDVGWTRDLDAVKHGSIRYHNGVVWNFTAVPVPTGEERERVVRATGQHPFPGNLVYRLGRRHVRGAGVFFRLEDTGAR